MSKPVIAVSVSLDPGVRLRRGVDYVYLKRSYGLAIQRAGGVPLLAVPEADPGDLLGACAGLVVSGGEDLPACAAPDGSLPAATADGAVPEVAERVAWERRLIDAFDAAERPVLGVCYGMQLLNLHFGGTLHESLPRGPVDHGGAGRFTTHGIARCGEHAAFAALPDAFEVSSSHRQALDRVAPGFAPLARASDGVVEAIGRGALLGVEWHPEQDATAAAIYGWLVAFAAGAGRPG